MTCIQYSAVFPKFTRHYTKPGTMDRNNSSEGKLGDRTQRAAAKTGGRPPSASAENIRPVDEPADEAKEDIIQKGDVNVQASKIAGETAGNVSPPDMAGVKPSSSGKASSKPETVIKTTKTAMSSIVNYVRRLFSFPLVREPITFCRADDFTATGEFDPSRKNERAEGDALETLCNYDKATKEIFEHILKERKEALASKDKYQYQPLDVSKYPPWDDATIERLRSTFQVFDVNRSGLIEFEELCEVLNEFGDKTPMEERRKHFDAVDINRSGAIDFEEFIAMTYALTVKSVDENAVPLAETYKRIDRNMARIRSLDVVQQLQSGLF